METAEYTNITQPGPFEGDRFAALFKKPFKKYVASKYLLLCRFCSLSSTIKLIIMSVGNLSLLMSPPQKSGKLCKFRLDQGLF